MMHRSFNFNKTILYGGSRLHIPLRFRVQLGHKLASSVDYDYHVNLGSSHYFRYDFRQQCYSPNLLELDIVAVSPFLALEHSAARGRAPSGSKGPFYEDDRKNWRYIPDLLKRTRMRETEASKKVHKKTICFPVKITCETCFLLQWQII